MSNDSNDNGGLQDFLKKCGLYGSTRVAIRVSIQVSMWATTRILKGGRASALQSRTKALVKPWL